MNNKQILIYAQDTLLKAGAQKTKCILTKREKNELNVVSGEISLFRTTFDTNLGLTAIIDDKQGSISINKLDNESIEATAKQIVKMAISSKPDKANDVAEHQSAKEFYSEPVKPDLDKMYTRLVEFVQYAEKNHPKTIVEEINFDFTSTHSIFINSNGIDYTVTKGIYTFVVMFTSKEGKKRTFSKYSIIKCLKEHRTFGIPVGKLLVVSSTKSSGSMFTAFDLSCRLSKDNFEVVSQPFKIGNMAKCLDPTIKFEVSVSLYS